MSSTQVAAYYFPQYHIDSRNEIIHEPGWSEWQIVKRAQQRFPGHIQPHVPLWGYEDEADPAVFSRKIAAAADHGIDCFIFDWYWYEGQPFLHRALEEGYMAAPNHDQLRFALMWANQYWCDLYPAPLEGNYRTIFSGNVTRAIFDDVCNYVIKHYFTNPGYWKIDGCPYFSIYELFRLIDNLGGISATRMALDSFRAKTRAAGFPDLHLNGVLWGLMTAPEDHTVSTAPGIAEALGLQSVTTYSWCHDMDLTPFPTVEYAQVAQEMREFWAKTAAEFPVPYHPTVSMGWDASPRTNPALSFVSGHYPYFPVMVRNTPDAFEAALRLANEFLVSRPDPERVVIINAWNEWTESSYLEPDTVHGMTYLEAVKKVFREKNG
jgi:hypothetical protein